MGRIDQFTNKVKSISKNLPSDNSILEFNKIVTSDCILIGETLEITIQIRSLRSKGVLDFIITDEIPDQFQLVGDMPQMRGQLNANERKQYKYIIQAYIGGYYEMTAMCELENRFTLDDIPSNQIRVYVSPLHIEIEPIEMIQGQWKPMSFKVRNMGRDIMKSIAVGTQAGRFVMEGQHYDVDIPSGESFMININGKTNEVGNVNCGLSLICTDDEGVKYQIQKDFPITVAEATTDQTNVNIESIGEIVSSGATQIKDSVLNRSNVGTPILQDTPSDSDHESPNPNDSVTSLEDKSSASTGFCSACGNQVNSEWKLCPHCGNLLELKCRNCESKIEVSWSMCPFCGQTTK